MKKTLPLLFLVLALTSCTSEFDQMFNPSRQGVRGPKTVFKASTESPSSPETKVYADEKLRVLWNADDRISVFNRSTYNYQYVFTGDDGDTAGGFEEVPVSGLISGNSIDNICAVYPYSQNTKMDNDGVLTMLLPTEQRYKEKSFGIGANTMVAVTADNFLAFKNVGGYLSIRLYGDDVKVKSVMIKGNNDEKIAGKAFITMPLGGTPSIVMDETATDAISIVCDQAVPLGATADDYTDFWFVIPPVYFSLGFTITVTDDMGGVFEKVTSKAFTVNRSTLDWMNPLEVVPNYDNVNVPFKDENFKAYCVENFDANKDGEISVSEASAVTDIVVCTDNIKSLEGIEYFSNLQYLRCFGMPAGDDYYRGQLEELDVSKNHHLLQLYCHNNNLTSLNVLGCSELKILDCYCNKLSSLDVSENVSLEWLDCWNNQLTSLDLSQNVRLTRLMCDRNRLSELNLSSNADLRVLVCSENLLQTLDISQNGSLTDIDCGNNQLVSLDISSNAGIRAIDLRTNPLEYLYVASGQDTFIQLPENAVIIEIGPGNASFSSTILQYLLEHYDTDGNGILSPAEINNVTSLEIEPAIDNSSARGIAYLPHLQSLSCIVADFDVTSEMTEIDVSHNPELTSLFMYCTGVTSLDLSNNPLLESIGLQMVPLDVLDVSNNPALTSLNFRSMQLNSLDVSSNILLKSIGFHAGGVKCLYLAKGQVVGVRHNDTYIYPQELILYDDIIYKGALPEAFPDAAFRRHVFESYDIDRNGILSQAECNAVTEINVNTDNIVSLTGIESFENLTRLTCKGSSETTGRLASLDVSHHPLLNYLDCTNNPLNTILTRPGNPILTVYKPDGAVIISSLEQVLDHLLSATNSFIASCEEASNHAPMSSDDSLSVFNALLDFVYAREPLKLYFSNAVGQDSFSYLVDNSNGFSPLPFALIDYEALKKDRYRGGELVGSPAGIQHWNEWSSFTNIATQLFNATLGSIFWNGSGSPQTITDIEATLNAENYKAFYGVCKYVSNPASIIPLN